MSFAPPFKIFREERQHKRKDTSFSLTFHPLSSLILCFLKLLKPPRPTYKTFSPLCCVAGNHTGQNHWYILKIVIYSFIKLYKYILILKSVYFGITLVLSRQNSIKYHISINIYSKYEI